MRHFLNAYEKLLAALALGAVFAGAGWTWRLQPELQAALDAPAQVRPVDVPHVPASWQITESPRLVWPGAPEQSAGSGWIYELFTPPAIYYSRAARAFAVTPARGPAATGVKAPPAKREGNPPVAPEPPRLQLAGYFGAPGRYVIAFVPPDSGETLLVRVGHRFTGLDLTLRSFEVKKVPVEQDGPATVYDVAGLATLLDERTGAEVVLDTRTSKPEPAPATQSHGPVKNLTTLVSKDVVNPGPFQPHESSP